MGVKLLPMQGGKGWEISVLFRTKRGRRRLRDKGRVASLPHAESRNLLSLRRWTTWWRTKGAPLSWLPSRKGLISWLTKVEVWSPGRCRMGWTLKR